MSERQVKLNPRIHAILDRGALWLAIILLFPITFLSCWHLERRFGWLLDVADVEQRIEQLEERIEEVERKR